MKVLLHYEDNESKELWKSLKITLPKSWKSGPSSQLLNQFVESYNTNETLGGGPNPLNIDQVHLAVRKPPSSNATTVPSNGNSNINNGVLETSSMMVSIASDAIVMDCISDRDDVYIMHGPSPTLQQLREEQEKIDDDIKQKKVEEMKQSKNMVACTRFGCQKRFPKGGPYPIMKCVYHKSPPVFHETAKFWSCCPQKKAYDFDDFQNIPGCCDAPTCTEVKEVVGQPLFLGGTDLREKNAEAVKLKSIDDFNTSQAAGGSDAAPVLDRLQRVLAEFDIDKELYDQVIDIYRTQVEQTTTNDVESLAAVKAEIGKAIKDSLKAVVVNHMRIK